MRNDVSLVSHLPAWHGTLGYSGDGLYVAELPIRHYERVMWTEDPERQEKVARSRELGWPASMEAVYLGGDELPRIALPWTAYPEYEMLLDIHQRGAQQIDGVLSPDGSAP